MERQEIQADIVVAGFGPAAAGFLLALGPELAKVKAPGAPLYASQVKPGAPLKVICCERADDLGFGVSGIVTPAMALRESFPDLDLATIPNAVPVSEERRVYLGDPYRDSRHTLGAAMKTLAFKLGGCFLKGGKWQACELPFAKRRGGWVLPMGSLMTWVAQKVAAYGIEVLPAAPVAGPLFEGDKVLGVRLADRGVAGDGTPVAGRYLPGLDVRAALTVVADGPLGAVGRILETKFGSSAAHRQNVWRLGMKVVVALP